MSGRVRTDESAVVFAGERAGEPVVVVMLSEGASSDSFGRARFLQAAADRTGGEAAELDDDPDFAPWVALRADTFNEGLLRADAIVAAITVADHASVGRPRGPGFLPHWFTRPRLGRWRLWPLPWPARLRASSMLTVLASFALMIAVATGALLIAATYLDAPPGQTPPPSGGPVNPLGPTVPGQPSPTPSGPSPTTPSVPSTQAPNGPLPTGSGNTPEPSFV